MSTLNKSMCKSKENLGKRIRWLLWMLHTCTVHRLCVPYTQHRCTMIIVHICGGDVGTTTAKTFISSDNSAPLHGAWFRTIIIIINAWEQHNAQSKSHSLSLTRLFRQHFRTSSVVALDFLFLLLWFPRLTVAASSDTCTRRSQWSKQFVLFNRTVFTHVWWAGDYRDFQPTATMHKYCNISYGHRMAQDQHLYWNVQRLTQMGYENELEIVRFSGNLRKNILNPESPCISSWWWCSHGSYWLCFLHLWTQSIWKRIHWHTHALSSNAIRKR